MSEIKDSGWSPGNDISVVGTEIGFQKLLHFQTLMINQAFANQGYVSYGFLIDGLDDLLCPYSENDDDFQNEITKAKEQFKIKGDVPSNSRAGLGFNRRRFRLLIKLMDRNGLLLDKEAEDEV